MLYVDPKTTSYETRQIVAKVGHVGHFVSEGKRYAIPLYVTFYGGKVPTAGMFNRVAPKDEHGFLRMEEIKEGEFVISPGIVYQKTVMTGPVMAEHLKAMKTFQPRNIISHERDTGPAIDLGAITLTKGDLTH